MAFVNTVTSVGDAALTDSIITRNITELCDDSIKTLGKEALRGCTKLTKVDLPNLDTIGISALQDCTSLETVILRKHLMCSLGSMGLNGTPIANGTGYVYVPKTVIDVYKGSSSWSALVNQIRAYEDYAYMFSNLGKAWAQSHITAETYVVEHANGLWVSVGTNGLCYSEDGLTWVQSNQTAEVANRVRYVNGKWFAYGNLSETMRISEDGKTWTTKTTQLKTVNAVAYANGLYVAARGNGYGLYYSEDAQTWTRSNITSGSFYAVDYNDGLWVAGGPTNQMYYSNDGKQWTAVSVSNAGTVRCLLYVNGQWIAGARGVWTSTDGQTWTQRLSMSSSTNNSYGLHYANNLFVLTVVNKGLYYSADGQTWKQSNITSGQFHDVTYGESMWVASGENTGLYYSTDGKTWQQSNITDVSTGTSGDSLRYANGTLVAATTTGIYYSEE